jgi:hypothetical protein
VSTIPVSSFSASFIRNIVKCGLRDKFYDIYRPYFQEDLIYKLYMSIQNGLMPQINTGKKRKRGGNKKTKKAQKKSQRKSQRKGRKGRKSRKLRDKL